MVAGHPVGGQQPGRASAQSRFNEHVRDPAREHETAQVHVHDFHTRDVRHFDARETEHWRGGHWHNDWHYGRFGWWFEVDDVWYAYPAPIFPYPLVVAPIVVEEAWSASGSTAAAAEAADEKYMSGCFAIAEGQPHHCGGSGRLFPGGGGLQCRMGGDRCPLELVSTPARA